MLATRPVQADFPTVDLRTIDLAPTGNPIESFMFFVPLLSPDPVATICSSNNTQCVRLVSSVSRSRGHSLDATYKFQFTGNGSYISRFENPAYRRKIASGTVLEYQLDYFEVTGSGDVWMDVVGTVSNGLPSVSEVRLHFDASGRSLVTANIYSLRCQNGVLKREKDTMVEVNTLIFKRRQGPVRMEVTFGSIRPKNASSGVWQDFVGQLKGKVANLVVKPMVVSALGNDAILEMGQAMAAGSPTFRFRPKTGQQPKTVSLTLA
jgi:hypothetical protein